MNKDHFFKQIKRLTNVFGGTYSGEHMDITWRHVQGNNDTHMTSAVDNIINARPVKMGLPTPKEIFDAVHTAYIAEWEKEKRLDRYHSKDFFQRPKNNIHKDVVAMINRFFTEDLTCQQKYELMLELGRKYPGMQMTLPDGLGAADIYKNDSIRTGRWVENSSPF